MKTTIRHENTFLLIRILRYYNECFYNQASQGKPLIRITSDKSHAGKMDEKDVESISKRSTPTLTIAIPSHEEDIRYTSSPESSSPLFFNANASAGNSPQHRKTYRDQSVKNDFKRQVSKISSFSCYKSRVTDQANCRVFSCYISLIIKKIFIHFHFEKRKEIEKKKNSNNLDSTIKGSMR